MLPDPHPPQAPHSSDNVRSMPRRGRSGIAPDRRDVELFWQERRAHKRRPLVARVELTDSDVDIVGVTENISQGGMFVSTFRCSPVGTVLTVRFSVPGCAETFTARVQVMRVRGGNPNHALGADRAPDVVPGMGLKFEDLPSRAFDAIGAYASAGR